MTYRQLYSGYPSARLAKIFALGCWCPYGRARSPSERQSCFSSQHLSSCSPCICDFFFQEVKFDEKKG